MPPSDPALTRLAGLAALGPVIVLSGAGLSTESGIPDYRGPAGAATRRHVPMTGQAFRRSADARRRYWARSHLGWGPMSKAQPNHGHHAVRMLEDHGVVAGTITQNVDGLHQAAGSRAVIDLHGRLDQVVCLDCGARTRRDDLRRRLDAANPGWATEVRATHPDGDVEVDDDDCDGFVVPACDSCAGTLKPDVVFFGEGVPQERVRDAYQMLAGASLLMVLGSSLEVFSGRRFVMRAVQDGVPVAIVNQGRTRGDDVATLKLDAALGSTLAQLVAELQVSRVG